MRLEIIDELPTAPRSNFMFNRDDTIFIEREVQKLLSKGVIRKCDHENPEFISNIFLRDKPDGSKRMILNLKKFNECVAYRKFKMDTIKSVLTMITPGSFMASLDLREAYYMIKICEEHQRYLKFKWGNSLYQFTSMPFGLTSAPRQFTKLLKPVLSRLRMLGHSLCAYIDDILIVAESYEACKKSVTATKCLFEQLGFLVHPIKSQPEPTQEIVFLGFAINSVHMSVRLTDRKIAAYTNLCRTLQSKPSPSVRDVAQLIGKLVSSFPAVEHGKLFYRQLERGKLAALKRNKGSFDGPCPISPSMHGELDWWKTNLSQASSPITHGSYDIVLQTDSTLNSWGATCNGQVSKGHFSHEEKSAFGHNINACELLAIFLALQSMRLVTKNKHVLIQCDNVTAVAHVNAMGGLRSNLCDELAHAIWTWCFSNNTWLSCQHIPGIDNTLADFCSRNPNNRTEWSLSKQHFQKIHRRFGPFDVDLFASRLNNKHSVFVSWEPDPRAAFVDAFTLDWSHFYFYAFPPFSVMGRCVQQIRLQKARGIIVAPLWSTQTWFADLMKISTDHPAILPTTPDMVRLPHAPLQNHPLLGQLTLIACTVSGIPSETEAFQTRQPLSSCPRGDAQRSSNTLPTSKGGAYSVVNGRLISFTHL